MINSSYTGPILDAHFHLWHYNPKTYPWLAENGLDQLRHDHLPECFGKVARDCDVTASVHVEAGWGGDDPVDESRWLAGLSLAKGVADKWVARVPLRHQDAERMLEEQASFDRVVGIRDMLTWHPDPAFSRAGTEHRMNDPIWRKNFSRLGEFGLSFDLLISPWQAEDAFRLAMDHPDTVIIVNHCGSPFDRDGEGMSRWRKGLRRLASAPNILIKISDPVAYDRQWSPQSLGDVIAVCINEFGPTRAMFASDYPVSRLHIGYGQWIEVFKSAVAEYTDTERRSMFFDTAAKTYRL